MFIVSVRKKLGIPEKSENHIVKAGTETGITTGGVSSCNITKSEMAIVTI
jgi:hypothetical protein